MSLGEVFRFRSDQALGYDSRDKLHVHLGKTDFFRAPAEHAFLFISSADYGACFPILASAYEFLKHDSYISCGKLVYYSRENLDELNIKTMGKLKKPDLVRLRNHLVDHDVMVEWEIQIACKALKAVL